LQQQLTERGIGTLIHYPVPPHLSGAYGEDGFKPGTFPLAEQLAKSVLSLPIGPHMKPEHVESVLKEVTQAVNENVPVNA
jgi:dTDP-4-amino-4,6-dideoxygalactose transaminase